MPITTARWADALHSCIRTERGERVILIPDDPDNRDRAEIDALGIVIGEYVPPPPPVPESVSDRQFFHGLANGGVITEEEPPPVPESVSDRQFFHGLANGGVITEEEALAAVMTGDLPSRIVDVLAEMTEADRRRAEMLFSFAPTFERRHPLVDALASALGYSSEQTDNLFRAAASL